jgi:hypothetical protein
VVNLQNDKYKPSANGTTKPMINATNVGRTKIGDHFFNVFSIFLPHLSKKTQQTGGVAPAC